MNINRIIYFAIGITLLISVPLTYGEDTKYIVIATIPMGDGTTFGNTQGLGVNPNTNRIYVANQYDKKISVIDGINNNVITTIPMTNFPSGIGVNTNTNRIYALNSKSENVSVIDGFSNTILLTLEMGNVSSGVDVNPITNLVYVANDLDHMVSVIDGTSNAVISTIPVGAKTGEMGVNPITNRVYVNNGYQDTISVIDGNTNTVIDTIDVGPWSADVGINQTTNRIYVPNIWGNNVSVIDGTTNTIVANIPAGDCPKGVTVDHTTNLIYVAVGGVVGKGAEGAVAIIDGSSNTVIDTIPVGIDLPGPIDVNIATKRVYVSSGDDKVYVIAPIDQINTLVNFEPNPSTYAFTYDTAGCPDNFVGKFTFDATLTNISQILLSNLFVEVNELTNNNLLLTDGGLVGESERFEVPGTEGYVDGIFSPEESVNVPFTVCLQNLKPFQFYVDVLGWHIDGESKNVLLNGSFEDGYYLPTGLPDHWSWDSWQPWATPTWDNAHARTGNKSVKIAASEPNDARFIQTVDVQSHTWHVLSGWIKTENVGHTMEAVDAGANLSLYGTWTRTSGVFGTQDWTRKSLLFNSGNDTQVTIGARLGYWSGTTTGTAWFDDLDLVPIEPMDPHPSWKILVLIYQNTDFEVTHNGTYHHYVAAMTQDEMEKAALAARQFVEIDIPALTSGNMIPEVTVRFPDRVLTELSPIGGGWWPSPEDTALERDPEFDSVIVIWDPRTTDLTTNTYQWIGFGDGLAAHRGTGQTYLSMQVDAAVYRGHRNVFKHEWGHCILFFFDAMGTTPNPTVSNHANATDYVNCQTGQFYDWRDETLANPIPDSIYNNESGFTHDYYSGTVATADQPLRCLGITPEAWALGGPVSHSGNLN